MAPGAWAADHAATPETYVKALGLLEPGDRLRLAGGVYRNGLPLRNLHGTKARPIVIEAQPGAQVVLVGRSGRNTVSLRQTSHVVIRNLVLDGANLEVDAVKAERDGGLVHDITLEGLVIVRHGVDQGINGISTKTPAASWTIRNNVIVGAGTGMYFGDSDGTAPFVGGLIEGNTVVSTAGYNLQIKHQRARPVADGMPAARQRTVIRGNFFSKLENASAGELARPNVLVGHFPPQGPGSDDEYLIAENVFFANPVEALLQAEGNVVIGRNLFLNPYGDAVAVIPHNDLPRRVEIEGNFIVAAGRGIRLEGGHAGFRQTVSGNHDYGGAPKGTIGDGGLLGRTFREWLASGGGSRPRAAPGPLERALRLACGADPAERVVAPPGLVPKTYFVCEQL